MLSQRADPSAPPLVLIVDRDPDTRAMYSEYLTRAGWTTEQAQDGRDALAKAMSRRPAVVVTETRLPFIDGYELCRLLRYDTGTAGVPIIFVTGDGQPAHLSRARNAGAEAVLVKPCLPEHLEREIRRVIGQTESDERERSLAMRERRERSVGGQPGGPTAARRSLVRAHHRHETRKPPLLPPALHCPTCGLALIYDRSHIGGVSEHHPEQWDYFVCPASCGTFQYRHRSRKLRPAS